MYVLQPYFKNRQVNCSFVECPVFLMLVLSPMLYMFLVISISHVISDFVICRSVLDVLIFFQASSFQLLKLENLLR